MNIIILLCPAKTFIVNLNFLEFQGNFCKPKFQNIELELQSCVSSDDAVEEVALLLGATIRSPQEIYRIKMPSVTFEESLHKEGERILLRLIR